MKEKGSLKYFLKVSMYLITFLV